MNPELSLQRASRLLDEANSDAMSDASSASGSGNRSSLSWALSRLNNVLASENSGSLRREYGRTHSSRELGSSSVIDNRRQQRYSRSSTAENIDSHSVNSKINGRLGSPFNPAEEDIPSYIPPTYRTYTRTTSREYLSPSGSRGTSPSPVQPANSSPATPSSAVSPNPIVPQLSTVLEFGPQGTESESPRLVRANESKKISVASVTNTNSVSSLNAPSSSTSATLGTDANGEKKSRRVSRFLRPDFYDTPKSESSYSTGAIASSVKSSNSSSNVSSNGKNGTSSEATYEVNKQRATRSMDKRWEKYNEEGPTSPSKVASEASPVIVFVREISSVKSPSPPETQTAAPKVMLTEPVVTKGSSNGEAPPPVSVVVKEISPNRSSTLINDATHPKMSPSPKVSPSKEPASSTAKSTSNSNIVSAKASIKDMNGVKVSNGCEGNTQLKGSPGEVTTISKVTVREIASPSRMPSNSVAAPLTPAKQLQQVRQNLEHAAQVQHAAEQAPPNVMRPRLNSVNSQQQSQQQVQQPPQQPNAIPKKPIANTPREKSEKSTEIVVEQESANPQPATKSKPVKAENGATGNKNAPKLTVRRQFEHLLNMAAAQFQRSQSPNKVAPAPLTKNNSSNKSTEAVAQSIEMQEMGQPEDEIKQKTPASVSITGAAPGPLSVATTKSENVLRTNSAASKPALPVKPDFLIPAASSSAPLSSAKFTAGPTAINSSSQMDTLQLSPVPGNEPQTNKYALNDLGSTSTLVGDNLSETSIADSKNLSYSAVPAHLNSKSVRELTTIPSSVEYSTIGKMAPNQNGRAVSVDGDEDVRFARVKRLEALETNEFYYDDAPETPTDSYESSSVCSDLRDRDLRESGEDESVSERIFRKSFYTRFNEPSKKKSQLQQQQQQQNRRSVSRDLIQGDLPNSTSNNTGGTSSGGLPSVGSSSNLPPRLPSKSRRSSRDESAEAVMVRKFLSSRSDGSDSGTLERDRHRYSSLAARRQQQQQQQQQQASDAADDNAQRTPTSDSMNPDSITSLRSSISRENSVTRSARSEVTSPTPSVASDSASSVSTRESRSFSRAYSSSRTLSGETSPASSTNNEGYIGSSGSLNRRSYYSSNVEHVSSLPRRTNRYSVHESEMSSNSGNSYSGSSIGARSSVGRSSYKGSPVSRYSSIFEETGRESTVLSPTSVRRTMGSSGISDMTSTLPSRRETTFYGMPSSRESSLNRREGAGLASSYFLRSTSSGLDYNGSGSSSSSSYATLRPSYLRTHRR